MDFSLGLFQDYFTLIFSHNRKHFSPNTNHRFDAADKGEDFDKAIKDVKKDEK